MPDDYPRLEAAIAPSFFLSGCLAVRTSDEFRGSADIMLRYAIMAADFHLVSLPLGSEAETLVSAVEVIEQMEPGETVFFSESLASTPRGSGVAFARLVALARQRNVNLVTTLNLGRDVSEDLPGRLPDARYNAVVIFTRHGFVHVPQAKMTTQVFEMDREVDGPGIGVTAYNRINLIRFDMDESLLEARFLIGSDLVAFRRFSPAELACDLLVVLGQFPIGAEAQARSLLGRAVRSGLCSTALLVNAFEDEVPKGKAPLAVQMEEAIDATHATTPLDRWPNLRSVRSAFFVYPEGRARSFAKLCQFSGRKGRIPLPYSRFSADITLGIYPITIVL